MNRGWLLNGRKSTRRITCRDVGGNWSNSVVPWKCRRCWWPFDAELFGHWWFEGPAFLSQLFQQAPQEGVSFTRLRDVLDSVGQLQLCDPAPPAGGKAAITTIG